MDEFMLAKLKKCITGESSATNPWFTKPAELKKKWKIRFAVSQEVNGFTINIGFSPLKKVQNIQNKARTSQKIIINNKLTPKNPKTPIYYPRAPRAFQQNKKTEPIHKTRDRNRRKQDRNRRKQDLYSFVENIGRSSHSSAFLATNKKQQSKNSLNPSQRSMNSMNNRMSMNRMDTSSDCSGDSQHIFPEYRPIKVSVNLGNSKRNNINENTVNDKRINTDDAKRGNIFIDQNMIRKMHVSTPVHISSHHRAKWSISVSIKMKYDQLYSVLLRQESNNSNNNETHRNLFAPPMVSNQTLYRYLTSVGYDSRLIKTLWKLINASNHSSNTNNLLTRNGFVAICHLLDKITNNAYNVPSTVPQPLKPQQLNNLM